MDFVENLKLMSAFPVKNLPGANNQGFPYWGNPPPDENLLIAPPPHQKIPPTPSRLPPPKVNSPSPTKQQFPSYNPIKTTFLAVVIAPAPFF